MIMKKQRKRRNLKASGGDTTYYNVEILTEKVALLVQLFKAVGPGTRSLGVARAA